jgi:hypothetical protein
MGAIYFARVGDYVKIGFASNPHQRVKTLMTAGGITFPDDIDQTQAPSLILVVPFCRIRDERNMQLLFGNHWVVGEWFRYSPAFRFQMQTMQFVTHAVRRKHLTAVRASSGGVSHQKEERWGMQTQDLLAHLADIRAELEPHPLARAS